jgi:PEGA domain
LPAASVLRVRSDVSGASVFVDRQYVGTTPLETDAVAPGSHQLQVSAEGYDSVSQRIDVASREPIDINVSLKTVRLEASVAAVHKHVLGSCQGTLRADVQGLRYDTTNREDAFHVRWAEVTAFDVDYAEKLLRVKRRDGRTWNFTTKQPNPDPLLVFHREVSAARARLNSGR